MTRDDIIRMAQECKLIGMRPHLDGIYEEALQEFGAMVAAAEREACAKVVENYCGAWDDEGYALMQAIRARGEA